MDGTAKVLRYPLSLKRLRFPCQLLTNYFDEAFLGHAQDHGSTILPRRQAHRG